MGGRQHCHPLLATRLLARIRQTWHVEVALRDFFAIPTIAHMAVLITEQQAVQTAPDVLAGWQKWKGHRQRTCSPLALPAMLFWHLGIDFPTVFRTIRPFLCATCSRADTP